ncbi:hypothetical protein [Streptomyces sp. DH12]|uniref:hypothetical protein n=1 Tax=Streptomyces sp. DH12 TaxID=2857010 RepID=UPI001E2FFF65|nr:hypothetical protein [Streptomyces sp. DH12]
MSAATFTPASGTAPRPRAGEPSGAADLPGSRIGGALRAVRVFTAAAFGVAVLGAYDAEAAGVVRRH